MNYFELAESGLRRGARANESSVMDEELPVYGYRRRGNGFFDRDRKLILQSDRIWTKKLRLTANKLFALSGVPCCQSPSYLYMQKNETF